MYSVAVSALAALVGTAQIRQWMRFEPRERLLWLSVAVLNLTAFVGSVEALVQGNPGGWRVYLTALAVTWLLATVLYGPVLALCDRWRTREERT